MAIYRVNKDKNNPYVMMNKYGLYDTELSWKAKGLLAHLLSRPDDWQVYEIEIQKHARDGRQSTRSALKELIEKGYIDRTQKRDDKGKFIGYEYDVYEIPAEVRKPDNGEPNIGESNTTNYRINQLLNKPNNDIYITLPSDGHFLMLYKNAYEHNMGKEHPRIRQKSLGDVLAVGEHLDDELDADEQVELIKYHFNSLPKSNNGNILAFMKALPRYLEELNMDLSDEIRELVGT